MKLIDKRSFVRLVVVLTILCVMVFVFRVRVANLITRSGISNYQKGNFTTASKYFKVSRILNPESEENKRYILMTESALGDSASTKAIIELLTSRNEDNILAGLRMVNEGNSSELRKYVQKIAETSSMEISEEADEILRKLPIKMRCSACGARYSSKIPGDKLPFICDRCGEKSLYPADRFYIAKMYCSSCKNTFVIERTPGKRVSGICAICGKNTAACGHICHSCGHEWGSMGAVFSCPECHAPNVGGMPVSKSEVKEYYDSH